MVVTSVRLDSKGRLIVPKEVREALGAREGDVFFFEFDREEGSLRYARADNPLLQRLQEGRAEYEAGLTRSLDEVAADLGISLSRD